MQFSFVFFFFKYKWCLLSVIVLAFVGSSLSLFSIVCPFISLAECFGWKIVMTTNEKSINRRHATHFNYKWSGELKTEFKLDHRFYNISFVFSYFFPSLQEYFQITSLINN